ncbi:hypothetical protein FGO68_gene7066 [Halteria grandinella]|uniref:Uncharacterized protein n=1 Tax=Halteria grandinella TaxID=5974 RepID=A0A8J8NA82_HALGN|nr:hypothetical protein FGO68_gene7066 [Halteria grandinella]
MSYSSLLRLEFALVCLIVLTSLSRLLLLSFCLFICPTTIFCVYSFQSSISSSIVSSFTASFPTGVPTYFLPLACLARHRSHLKQTLLAPIPTNPPNTYSTLPPRRGRR